MLFSMVENLRLRLNMNWSKVILIRPGMTNQAKMPAIIPQVNTTMHAINQVWVDQSTPSMTMRQRLLSRFGIIAPARIRKGQRGSLSLK